MATMDRIWAPAFVGAIVGAVAATLLSDVAMPYFTHKEASISNVSVTAKFNSQLVRFVIANDSDDVVDFSRFEVVLLKTPEETLGGYMAPSRVYSQESSEISFQEIDENKFRVTGELLHTLPPKGRDSFVINVETSAEIRSIEGFLIDEDGKKYPVSSP